MKVSPIAIAIGWLLLVAAGGATACSPSPNHDASMEAAVARSEQIFVAQVVKSELLPASPGKLRAQYVVATYTLERALKGQPPAVGVVLTSLSNCGIELSVGSQFLFFVDLQRTRYGIPEVDRIPTGTQAYRQNVQRHRLVMDQLQTALKPQSTTH